MAKVNPKIVKVTMAADPDPYAIVHIYWEKASAEGCLEELRNQQFKLHLMGSEKDEVYPPSSGEYMINSKLFLTPQTEGVHDAEGRAKEVICYRQRFLNQSDGKKLPFTAGLNGNPLKVRVTGSDPSKTYEVLYPLSDNDIARFLYREFEKKGD